MEQMLLHAIRELRDRMDAQHEELRGMLQVYHHPGGKSPRSPRTPSSERKAKRLSPGHGLQGFEETVRQAAAATLMNVPEEESEAPQPDACGVGSGAMAPAPVPGTAAGPSDSKRQQEPRLQLPLDSRRQNPKDGAPANTSRDEARKSRVAWAAVEVESLHPVCPPQQGSHGPSPLQEPPLPPQSPGPSQGLVRSHSLVRSQSQLGVFRGSMDDLRRRVDEEIVSRKTKTDSAPGFSAGELIVVEPTGARTRLLRAMAARCSWANRWVLRIGGALPFSQKYVRLSMGYQCAVLLLHCAILAGLVVQAKANFTTGDNLSFLLSDLILASGCAAGLLAVVVSTGTKGLQLSLAKLEEANGQQDSPSTVEAGTAVDTLVTLLVWLTFLADRLGFLISSRLTTLPWTEVLRHVCVLVCSAELSLLVLVVLRVVRNMSGLVDGFCTKFLVGSEYVTAVSTWNVLQASIRTASAAVEGCFAVLLSCLVLLALAMALDVRTLHGVEWVTAEALTTSGLLILGLSQILLRAAAVTDSCIRISQLVNSTDLSDNAMDAERTYLVDYITASGAGFYIFNVRLSAGISIKVLHYTGLLAFTLARMVLPAGSQL